MQENEKNNQNVTKTVQWERMEKETERQFSVQLS